MTLSIPGYQIGELLGYGSHGEVWSAMSRRTGEHVALKRIQLSGPDAATAVRAEAALLASLSHPNVIGLREFIESGDSAVLVMELAAGGSLTDLLTRRRTLTASEVGVCFSDLAAALAHAHDEGVLHGDISAANVLFTADGRAKLADLGLARLLSQSSVGLGTPTYLDPVVAAGGAAGAASDVFSLAAVALHALTGAGPWSAAIGGSAEAVLAVAASGEVADLDARLADSPAELSAALVRALDPEPGRRGTAAELALDLRAAVPPSTVTVHAGRLGPSGGRHYAARPAAARPATARPGSARPESARAGASRAGASRAGAAGDGPEVQVEPGPLSRPDFARPPSEGGLSADLTHAARPAIRAMLAPPPLARGRFARMLGNRRRLAAIGCAALACVGLGVIASVSGHGVAAALAQRGEPKTSARPAAVSPTNTKTSAATRSTTLSAQDVADALRVIDSRRSAAYATGQDALLDDVYDSAALLAQDTAQLRHVLPAGCGISPLTTEYSDVVISAQTPDRVQVRASVSTSTAQLSCDGRVAGHIPATAPAVMAITVTRQPDGDYRIESQKPA